MNRTMQDSGNGQSPAREWITPGTALAFSLLMLVLAPAYTRWFGDAMPPFTLGFLAFYPLWIALSAAALLVAAVGAQFPVARRWPALWRSLDVVLTVASILVIAGGIIALFLPLLLRPMPG